MTSAHEALEAWVAGELPDAAAMELTGARDATELLLMAQSHGEPIRREPVIRRCAKCGAHVVGRRLAPCCLD
jgi:hypothetical protein